MTEFATICGKELSDYRYRAVRELWVITCYYNPCGYQSRRRNYQLFAQVMRASGINLLTIQCAFGNQPFDLPESLDVIRVRSRSVLWQKERLLNLANNWLPAACRFVAWLDCDLIFANPAWAIETAALLEQHAIVQLFQSCHRLPQDASSIDACGDRVRSFASITPTNLALLYTGRFDEHGHTGYGWAARREILDQHGLYEYAIAGSADHAIAHAAFGDFNGPCLQLMMDRNPRLLLHFRDWAAAFYRSVQGRVAAVSGEVLHLWHGELEHRQYLKRHQDQAKLGFDPYTDLVDRPGQPFEWNPQLNKPALEQFFCDYFAQRKEDGAESLVA